MYTQQIRAIKRLTRKPRPIKFCMDGYEPTVITDELRAMMLADAGASDACKEGTQQTREARTAKRKAAAAAVLDHEHPEPEAPPKAPRKPRRKAPPKE